LLDSLLQERNRKDHDVVNGRVLGIKTAPRTFSPL